MAKRHESLISLSHDHHHGLALGLRLRQGNNALLNDGWTHDRREQARRVQIFYDEELSIHFRLEEEILFPAMINHDADSASLVQGLIAEHRQMEDLIVRARSNDPLLLDQVLTGLGAVLEHHIRVEERELFPKFEQIIPQEAALRLGEEIENRRLALITARGHDGK